MSAHSRLAPSSYGRLAHCRAAPIMEAMYPSEDSEATRSGKCAHHVAKLVLDGLPAPMIGTQEQQFETEVTEEMIQGVQMYVDDIAGELGAAWRNHLYAEERVDLSGLHPEAWGTLDARAQYPGHLFFWDFKYGHRYVDAFENWQLIAYSYPFVAALTPEEELTTTVQFTIVQPRNFHPDGPIRRWTVKAHELRAYYNILAGWLAEAMDDHVAATPFPAACQDCSARHACVALRNAAYTAMDSTREAHAQNLPPEQLGIELARVEDLAALLDAYKTGLEEEAAGVLKRGASVPNYTMAPGRASLEWSLPPEFLANELGDRIWKPRAVITPTQAKAQRLISDELLAAYATRPPAALKLSRVDHKLAKKVFK
jgi:hypothetical protein